MGIVNSIQYPLQVTSYAELRERDTARCIVYRDGANSYHLTSESLSIARDVVAAGSPRAMEAVLRLMRTEL